MDLDYDAMAAQSGDAATIPHMLHAISAAKHPKAIQLTALLLTRCADEQLSLPEAADGLHALIHALFANDCDVYTVFSAVAAIENIVLRDSALRDLVLAWNYPDACQRLLAAVTDDALTQAIVTSLIALCHDLSTTGETDASAILAVFARVAAQRSDRGCMLEALRGAQRVVRSGDEHMISKAIGYDLITSSLSALQGEIAGYGHHENGAAIPMRLLGNMVGGSADQAMAVILYPEFLPLVEAGLCHPDDELRLASAYVMTNLLSNSRCIIDAAMPNSSIFPALLGLTCDIVPAIRIEAALALLSLMRAGSFTHVRYAVSCNCILAVTTALEFPEPELIALLLDCMRELLRYGACISTSPASNLAAIWLKEAGAERKLALLLMINDTDLRQRVHALLRLIADGSIGDPDQPLLAASEQYHTDDGLASLVGRFSLN